MSNILILHSGLQGITNACLEMARRLEKNNNTVFTATIKDQEDLINKNRLNYLKVTPIQFAFNNKDFEPFGGFLKTALFSKNHFFKQQQENLDFTELDKIIHNRKIDLLLIDTEMHEYIIYAYSQKISIILISQWFSISETQNNYPPGSKHEAFSVISHKISWLKSKVYGYLKTNGNNIKSLGLNRRQFLLFLASEIKFDKSKWISYNFPLPFSYKSLPCISMTHKELEIEADENLTQFYTYPMVCEDRVELTSKKFDNEFQEIKYRIKDEKKSLIVVTQTTMKTNSNKLNSNIIKALSQLEDCISIVSTGIGFELDPDLYKISNVYIYQSIPQLDVFKYANISINHGGIHTINECIHFKLPMLIYSGQKYDQNGCSARVAKYGCGIARFKQELCVEDVKSDIKELLYNQKYSLRINELNSIYLKAKSTKVFEQYISTFLQEKKD